MKMGNIQVPVVEQTGRFARERRGSVVHAIPPRNLHQQTCVARHIDVGGGELGNARTQTGVVAKERGPQRGDRRSLADELVRIVLRGRCRRFD